MPFIILTYDSLSRKELVLFRKYDEIVLYLTPSIDTDSLLLLEFDYLILNANDIQTQEYLDKNQRYLINYTLLQYQHDFRPPLYPNVTFIYEIPDSTTSMEDFHTQLGYSAIRIQQQKRIHELTSKNLVFEPFQTMMNVSSDRRIITFSDIHGDIDALIVCLRDCAGVIRKKTGHLADVDKERDPELDTLLQYDINDNRYPRDLHYEWVGGNAIVVIIGDLIDPVRPDTFVDPTTGVELFYYPQVELKILHFINALNEHSLGLGHKDYGRIIKLCGNHEMINFRTMDVTDEKWIRTYSFSKDKGQVPYYQGISRTKIFGLGQEGFNLYQQTTGTGVLLKINNNIFVHGEISHNIGTLSLSYIDSFNEFMNDPKMISFEKIDPTLQRYYVKILNHLLEGRTYGIPQGADLGGGRMVEPRLGDPVKQAEFCQRVRSDIRFLCEGDSLCGQSPEGNMRLFLGHCQQNNFNPNVVKRLFGTIEYKNERIEILNNDTYVDSHHDVEHPHGNRSFGITTECELDLPDGRFHPQIINVDVGMGRGQFENKNVYDNFVMKHSTETEREFFLSKIPQVMEITGDRLRLIRSTLFNYSIHVPRPYYKNMVQEFNRVILPLIKAIIRRPSLTNYWKMEIKNITTRIQNSTLLSILGRIYHQLKTSPDTMEAFLSKYVSRSIYEGSRRKKIRKSKKKSLHKK